jgi:hypothetical protein
MSTFLTTGQLKQDIVEIAASSSTPLALTSLSPTIINVTTGIGTQLIILPDATKLETGIHYIITNNSTDIVTIQDFTLTTIATVDVGFCVATYLSSNSVVAGKWVLDSSASSFVNKNIKLLGGGTWAWDLTTETLSFSDAATIILPGLPSVANTILSSSVIVQAGKVAYVMFNRKAGGPPLTIQTALPNGVPVSADNVLIIAYRDGNDIVIGSSLRLIPTQSGTLDQGLSQQTQTLLGTSVTPATSSPDWTGRGAPLRTLVDSPTVGILDSIVSVDTEIDKFFGQLRLIPNTSADVIDITGTDRSMLTGETLSQELGSRVLTFDGAAIDFTTGVITTPTSSPLGLNFTPYAIPTSEYFWYCLLIEYTGTTALGQSAARVRVGLASASNASQALAPFPQFPALFRSKPLGFIQVFNNAGNIEVVNIRQLGVGSGSGGGGGSGLISVRAADFVTTTLPTGTTLTVDGVTIANEDMILYGNAALNRVYKVTGIGSSISFEEVGVFTSGSTVPQDGNQVAVADGNSNDVVWEWDEDTSTWSFVSLSTENKQWLGLDVPTKTGGSFSTKVDPLGQTNNVVVEGETLEKTLKRLDIRPDVLKRVRVIDLTTTVLPATASVVIDGVTLVNGDKVLFGDVSLLGIYQVLGIGVGATWTKLNEFGGSQTPASHDAVLVREGTEVNCTIWLYDSALTPPWHRVSGPASTVWTGTTPYNTPSWDGTLSTADTNVKLALDTIDKYFRGLQLRRHLTDPKRVTILASATTKTDLTVLNFTVADRLLSFAGAEINFETGNIYASDGLTIIGTFPPQAIPASSYYWYAIGLDSAAAGSDNTINPQITINFSTGTGVTPAASPKPSLTARYTLGAVVVQGGVGGIGITPITQASIVYLGQFTGFTDLEATVAQNTIDIAALQAYYASLPQQQKFIVGAGGQSVFNLTTFTVNASNTVFDVDYLIDGRWQTQSVTGDFLDGGAVKKNSTTQVQTAEVVPEGKEFIVIKRTMSGGDPLVDLEGITVNLGFITPKTVGTLLRPASSLILKDKVTADIWELEVSNGVFQVVKIN